MFDEMRRTVQEELLRKHNLSPFDLFSMKHRLYRIALTAVAGVIVNDLYARFVFHPAADKRMSERIYSQ